MASRFETFSEDEICAINEAVVQANTKKALDKICEIFVNCKQSSY